jgi:hypothetical protein
MFVAISRDHFSAVLILYCQLSTQLQNHLFSASVATLNLTTGNWTHQKSKFKLFYDWRFIVNQFILATNPFGLTTSNFIFQLNTCGNSPYVTSPLTRGWVCRLQFLLVLATAVILRSESRGTQDYIWLSQIRDTQLGGPGPRIYIPQEQGGPVTSTRTGGIT